MARKYASGGMAALKINVGRKQGWKEYLLLIIGTWIVAVSFTLFLAPNQIASGGVQGISILIDQLMGIAPAYTQWSLNIPLLLIGIWVLGNRFGIKTAFTTVLIPLFVLMTDEWTPLTNEPLLAAIFGGLGVGAGVGMVFRGRGSTGGLDVAAQILAKSSGLNYATSVAILDGFVIVAAGFIFGAEQGLYALISLFVATKAIDRVQLGFATAKVAYIITGNIEQIAQAVLYELDRGLTRLAARGGYTGEERIILMVVLSQFEVSRLKVLVASVDPRAFIVITEATEVLGEGFKVQ
jgi:uncharacterized membrane-anchored protein YitT (DUF2179 family)